LKKEDFDKLFDEAFDEAAKRTTMIPDATPSWDNMQRKIRSKKKQRKLLGILPVAAASFLLGAFLFGSPAITTAFSPFFDTVKHIQQNVVSFIFGTKTTDSGALTPPPDEQAGIEESESSERPIYEKSYASWNEAVRHVTFSPINIPDIPPDYKLSEVRLYSANADSPASEARLVYFNQDNQRLLIKLSQIPDNAVITSSHVKEEGTFTVIEHDGLKAYYFAASSGHAMLEFVYADIHISFSGVLAKETFVQMAENIKTAIPK